MAVENGPDFESIDGFFQAAGAEKGVNFRVLSLERGTNWGVVKDHDALFRLQFGQRLLQTNSVANGLLNESRGLTMRHPLTARRGSAAERCSHASNIWWTCTSGHFVMRV